MTLGVRSYGSSLLMQNVYNPDKLPDRLPELKAFAKKVLSPMLKCVEEDCGTTIGRKIDIPETDAVGLVSLETNELIVEQDIIDTLIAGKNYMRVRDSAHCISEGGFCSKCGVGFMARVGRDDNPGVGHYYDMSTTPRSYQNYVASTYSGSLIGFSTLSSDPMGSIPSNWDTITNHVEMDSMCNKLATLKVSYDELAYIRSVESILERALLIIGVYGVYAYAGV